MRTYSETLFLSVIQAVCCKQKRHLDQSNNNQLCIADMQSNISIHYITYYYSVIYIENVGMYK